MRISIRRLPFLFIGCTLAAFPKTPWYPASYLVHPDSDAWPWTSSHSDHFRVLTGLDMDGVNKMYDTKWAASVFMWRDWVNDVLGGICIGSPLFTGSVTGCYGGQKKKVMVVAIDMQLGGTTATNDPLYQSFYATNCLEPAAVRAHAFLLSYEANIKNIGNFTAFSVTQSTSVPRSYTNQMSCGVPMLTPGAIDHTPFTNSFGFFFTAMPPAFTFPKATVDVVFRRHGAKTYGVMNREKDATGASLLMAYRMTMAGQLPGTTPIAGLTEVGKVCSAKRTFPKATAHIQCEKDVDCPTGQSCVNPQFSRGINAMMDAVDMLEWFGYWKKINPDVLIFGSGDYADLSSGIEANRLTEFLPKAIISLLPWLDASGYMSDVSLFWRGASFFSEAPNIGWPGLKRWMGSATEFAAYVRNDTLRLKYYNPEKWSGAQSDMQEISSYAITIASLMMLQKAVEKASNPVFSTSPMSAKYQKYTLADAHGTKVWTTLATNLAGLGDCGTSQNKMTGDVTGTSAPCAADSQCPGYGYNDTTCFTWETFLGKIGLAAVHPTLCPVESCPAGMNMAKEIQSVQVVKVADGNCTPTTGSGVTAGICQQVTFPGTMPECTLGGATCSAANDYSTCTCPSMYKAPWAWTPPPVATLKETNLVPIIGGLVGGFVFVIILIILYVYVSKRWAAHKVAKMQAEMLAKRKAAMGAQGQEEDVPIPAGKIVLVDTDVEASTALWEWSPTFMSKSLLLHDEVLRSNLKKTEGMELMTEGDAFLVCFTDPQKAVDWCMGVQEDLMKVEWPTQLINNGMSSSSYVKVQGIEIFNGLRVRMGAHYAEAGVPKASLIGTTGLMKITRSVSDFAHGGQALFSNDLYAAVKDTMDRTTDVAPIGSIANIDEDSMTEDGPEKTDNTSVVQLLPGSLKKRLPEFVVMYEGNEDQVRPPCGQIACVFTYCQDYKALNETDPGLASQEILKVDNLLSDCAEDFNGYVCKGQTGKFFVAFEDIHAALTWASEIQMKLLKEVPWDPRLAQYTKNVLDPKNGETIFAGLKVCVGINVGVPTMFNFNKTSAKMDYFGQVVNRAARVMALSAPGEIVLSKPAREAVSGAEEVKYTFEDIGFFALKGVTEEQQMFSCMPVLLSARFEVFKQHREMDGNALMSPLSPVSD